VIGITKWALLIPASHISFCWYTGGLPVIVGAIAAALMIYIKNQMVSFMKHTVEVMIPEAEIKARIAELGRQINEHYKDSGSEMVLVGLLRGSFMFMADLCREVQVPHEVDFMTASSYGSGMSTTRDVKILKDLDEDIRGKDVLIVEDIIDSGNTLSKVRDPQPA
jgi:hypoxanthine phosphoribosyltransferase